MAKLNSKETYVDNYFKIVMEKSKGLIKKYYIGYDNYAGTNNFTFLFFDDKQISISISKWVWESNSDCLYGEIVKEVIYKYYDKKRNEAIQNIFGNPEQFEADVLEKATNKLPKNPKKPLTL